MASLVIETVNGEPVTKTIWEEVQETAIIEKGSDKLPPPTAQETPISFPPGYNATLAKEGEVVESEGSLAGAAIGGIVAGSVLGFVALAVAIFFTVRRVKGRSNNGMFNNALNRSALRLGTMFHFGSHKDRHENDGPDGLPMVGSSAMGGLEKQQSHVAVGAYDPAAYSTSAYGAGGMSNDTTMVSHRGSDGEGSGSAGAGSRRGSWWKKDNGNIGVAF